jgi:hypothetical protein
MGKKSSSTVAIAGGGSKKLKKSVAAADLDAPTIGNWCHSKFVYKDPRKASKDGLLKDDAAEAHVVGPEITPTPPAGFQVMFFPFILRGLSFPLHEFLCGFLFAYGIQ